MSSYIVVCFGWQLPGAEPEMVLELAAKLAERLSPFGARLIGWSSKWRTYRIELSTGNEPVLAAIRDALGLGLAHGAGVSDRAISEASGQCWGPGLFAAEQLAACARHGELLVEQSAVQLIGVLGSEPEMTSVQIGDEVVDAALYDAAGKSDRSERPSAPMAAHAPVEAAPESLASTDYIDLGAESVEPDTLRHLVKGLVDSDPEHYAGPWDRPTISEFPPTPASVDAAVAAPDANQPEPTTLQVAALDDEQIASHLAERAVLLKTNAAGDSAASSAERVAAGTAETGTAETGTAETGTAETGTAETGTAEVGDIDADAPLPRRLSEPPPKPSSRLGQVAPDATEAGADVAYIPDPQHEPLDVSSLPPQRLSEPPPKPNRRPSSPAALAVSESRDALGSEVTRTSQPPPGISVTSERISAPSPALSDAPRRLSNPPPKPSRPVSRAALREAISNLDEPSPPSGVDLRAVLGAPSVSAQLASIAPDVDVKAASEAAFTAVAEPALPGAMQAAALGAAEPAGMSAASDHSVEVANAAQLDARVQAAMLSLARGEVRHGLLGLAEVARSARKLGPERACSARLSLAAGLVKAGRPREALAEALEAYGYAVSAGDESLQRACGKLLLQLTESHGPQAAAEPWRQVVAVAERESLPVSHLIE